MLIKTSVKAHLAELAELKPRLYWFWIGMEASLRRWLATNLLELLRDAAAGGLMLVGLLVLLWLLGLTG